MATRTKKTRKGSGTDGSDADVAQQVTSSLPPTPRHANSQFPIVGIGASAGGIEAVTELLRNLPDTPGMAFVLIQHQLAKHVSSLPQVLARATSMDVAIVVDGLAIRNDTLYVAPGDADVSLESGVLHLHPRSNHATMPIDIFLRSLAADQGSRAIAVILSGAASDGALGARAVKAEGGITFAQDITAKFDSMPMAAISAGAIDFIMPPAGIAKELLRIAQTAYVTSAEEKTPQLATADLLKIFALLHASHDIDFTHYKPGTIERRIRRRMTLHRCETLREYVEFVHANPSEIEQLYSDLLIRVTAFFRDVEVFEALKRDVVPVLLRDRSADSTIRVWVPGCATGEEVYSLAIVLLESAGSGGTPIQIFGTDVSEVAIDRARAGQYPENIAADISPERLRRFFTRVNGGYRVSKTVRDCCIFARQNLTKDPPFSKVDLISCRNVMIYLGPVLQRRVMAVFHYALRANGFLLLGNLESVSNFSELFSLMDRKNKIYQKKPAAVRLNTADMTAAEPPEPRAPMASREEEIMAGGNIFREADRVLLARYAPAGVLINETMEILQFRGRTSAYLEPAPGTASLNLLKMAREGLLAELRSAIVAARRKGANVRREGVRIRTNDHMSTISIDVVPFTGPSRERFFLVMFDSSPDGRSADGGKKKGKGKKALPEKESTGNARLKRELDATREYLQSIIEEQEAMNEELRSANEEIQSSNEELQSTNEELETAKEELQSSNEELTTLNDELESRNQELAHANNDLVNLLTSIDLPIVMLDSEMRIRRSNPGAQRVLGINPADTGRSIRDVRTTLQTDNLESTIAQVIETLEVHEREVRDAEGRWYSLRIRPYKTIDNKIDGAVLVMVDIKK